MTYEAFVEKLGKIEKKSSALRKRASEADARRKAQEEEWKEREERLFPKKLPIAKRIMEWSKRFAGEEEYEKVRRLVWLETEGVAIFQSGWGHEISEYRANWSRVLLMPGGLLKYVWGHKFYNSSVDIDSAESMATLLSYSYLKEFDAFISSGRIWKFLLHKLKFQEKIFDAMAQRA
ncbi:MAG: hypothetical protein QXT43_00925 [Candidatus Micrarchaeaceae archaeon]